VAKTTTLPPPSAAGFITKHIVCYRSGLLFDRLEQEDRHAGTSPEYRPCRFGTTGAILRASPVRRPRDSIFRTTLHELFDRALQQK
jgi:hypothetical protein